MSWIKNGLTLLISTLISLLMVEVGLRVIAAESNAPISIDHDYGLSVLGSGYGNSCDHGWCANPGVYKNNVKKVSGSGEIIYSVTYSIGANNLRETPTLNYNTNTLLNFYGGSFVFGEGLNDTETLAYYSQLASPGVEAKNYGFHGHGVHNAYRLLTTQKAKPGSFNLLLTGTYHAHRSACIPSYAANHPWYAIINMDLVYKGKCSENNENKGWPQLAAEVIAKANSDIHSRVLKILTDFLQGSYSLSQIRLYQELIHEFHVASGERGEIPIVLYMKGPNTRYLTAGSIRDPMPDYFKKHGIRFIDVTLPDERGLYIHDLDKHPSALANCKRAKTIATELGLDAERLICSQP